MTKNERRILRCGGCRFIWIPAGVARSACGVSVYEDEDSIFLRDGNENYYLDEINILSARIRLEWVRKYVPPGARMLEAGAGFGHFLKTAADSYDICGFDISPTAIAWSQEHLGVPNRVASIYEIPEDLRGPFDAMVCWDVIEHLADPLTALEQLRGALKPEGLLFLSTPDTGSFKARLLGRHWPYIDPVQHISLFSRENLSAALATRGFEVVDVRPLGHYYRLRYVFDRLLQLQPSWPVRWAAQLGRRFPSFVLDRKVYLRRPDVMGVAARRER